MEEFIQWLDAQPTFRDAADRIADYFVEHGIDQEPMSYQAIQQWLKNGIPARRVRGVSAVTGIPVYKLDPVLYPPEEFAA